MDSGTIVMQKIAAVVLAAAFTLGQAGAASSVKKKPMKTWSFAGERYTPIKLHDCPIGTIATYSSSVGGDPEIWKTFCYLGRSARLAEQREEGRRRLLDKAAPRRSRMD